ncbi:uncharacterized protein LOC129287074 [Prosopis cineraria]|uniref:uncharacterized protein LOC129287074 n=1 Tax=Prosopis cineraria TaxID=364024 RepID=UPI00240EB8DD|nr:uncharacterized protein LOC129287074 [Prosopis cineraria]
MSNPRRGGERGRDMANAYWDSRGLEIVKKHDSRGLIRKRMKLTSTRKANAKKLLHRVCALIFLLEDARAEGGYIYWSKSCSLSELYNLLFQKHPCTDIQRTQVQYLLCYLFILLLCFG